MNHYAIVTLKTGETLRPVGLWVGGHTEGVRFYHAPRGKVKLLAAAPGLQIIQFGKTERERTERGMTKVRLPDVLEGPLPESFESITYLATCACSSPLKSFVAPNTWEEVVPA